jgi:alkanesulfonate monooxygenase SsuD/methylene tetrahydromethanopterin reductase-like flavin-dependent oxidoreductase (luciferase family)
VTEVPAVDTAQRFVERRTRGRPDVLPRKRMVLGAPATVRAELEEVAAAYGTNELLIVNITYEHAARLRSYELLADAFSLAPR